jgi:hypothetical protein
LQAAGGGTIYFKFDRPRALDKAVEAHPPRPPLCVLSSTEMFDDDYVNEAGEQLATICDDLDGKIVTGQGPSERLLRKQAKARRKPATKPSPVAYIPCSGGLSFHHHPDSASGIEVHGVDCATARQFVHIAHASPCNARDCHVQGYACKTDAPATQTVSISCVNGERRLRWLWTGGY